MNNFWLGFEKRANILQRVGKKVGGFIKNRRTGFYNERIGNLTKQLGSGLKEKAGHRAKFLTSPNMSRLQRKNVAGDYSLARRFVKDTSKDLGKQKSILAKIKA